VSDDTLFVKEAMPTQGGTTSGWKPQFLSADGWKDIPLSDGRGRLDDVPDGAFCHGIRSTMYLCGYAQAQALAWAFSAHSEAQTRKPCEIRVVEYRIHYDIKCYRALEA
jgi:hypothetical protein